MYSVNSFSRSAAIVVLKQMFGTGQVALEHTDVNPAGKSAEIYSLNSERNVYCL